MSGTYDRKTIFASIDSLNLQNGSIIVQAHATPDAILLSVSLKISEELFQGLDREMCPPGLSYIKTLFSAQDPDSVLWKIENTEEGVITFQNCLLPASAYNPQVIKFMFPFESLSFSPPVTDNSEKKLLKFNHQRGKLAYINMSGDPPVSNPPLNESRIRHYNSNFKPRSEFQEPYQESQSDVLLDTPLDTFHQATPKCQVM